MLNLVQLQDRLRDVPMQALMQYANGANPDVPPFLALGELNRRKKMQESAAAEQAQEMEGAPTIKEQIEQAAGLMALQGNRQQQATQQQQGAQANAPMPAPNTTTSEPAQLASGGFIEDIVVPRDFQSGGGVNGLDALRKMMLMRKMQERRRQPSINPMKRSDYADGGAVTSQAGIASAMNPEMLRQIMAMMKKRRPGQPRSGVSELAAKEIEQMPKMAGGGIVAFAGPQGSFVESSPGFYELEEETEKQPTMTPEQQRMYELLDRLKRVKSIEERKKEAGLGEPPEPQAERLRAVEEEKKRFDEGDTFTNRLLALQAGRFGSGKLGRSAADYEARRQTTQTDIAKRMAEIKDLKAKAAYDAKLGNIEKARTEELDAINKEQALLKDIGEAGYKSALRDQALAGRTSEGDRAAQAYLRAKKAQGDERPDDVILNEGYINYVRERGASFERARTGAETADVTTIDKARNNVDARLKDVKSAEFREVTRRIAQDRKNAAQGNPTNLAEQYKNELYQREVAALRRQPMPQSTGGSGSVPPPPPGFVPQR